jgi:hypothetical protein
MQGAGGEEPLHSPREADRGHQRTSSDLMAHLYDGFFVLIESPAMKLTVYFQVRSKTIVNA